MFGFISKLFGKAKADVKSVENRVEGDVLVLRNRVDNFVTKVERKTVASIVSELRKLEDDLKRVKNMATQDADEIRGKISALYAKGAEIEKEVEAAKAAAVQIGSVIASSSPPPAAAPSPTAGSAL